MMTAGAGSVLHVRPGGDADVPAMTALYNRFVEGTAVNFDVAPFTIEERRVWFRQFAREGRHRIFAAEIGGAFAGYAASMSHKEKRAYETSVETTIYVAPDFARRGVGRALYTALFESLEAADVHSALAGVALPNEASVALHRAFGFKEVGTFHEVGRKFGRYWDVMWFEKRM